MNLNKDELEILYLKPIREQQLLKKDNKNYNYYVS